MRTTLTGTNRGLVEYSIQCFICGERVIETDNEFTEHDSQPWGIITIKNLQPLVDRLIENGWTIKNDIIRCPKCSEEIIKMTKDYKL